VGTSLCFQSKMKLCSTNVAPQCGAFFMHRDNIVGYATREGLAATFEMCFDGSTQSKYSDVDNATYAEHLKDTITYLAHEQVF
jgi:hypothetical protein